jgi:carbon-monoxide dehydrogenase medium subunit
MKPAPFHYRRPSDVAEALACLRAEPDGKVLAGGQSLLAVMNLRLARPSHLIDIGRLGELDRIFDDTDSVIVGALCTHRRLETDPLLRRRTPLLSEAVGHVGHISIRNQGTVGGSVAHADPAAEIPAVLVALGTTLYTDSHERPRREIPAHAFFVSFYTTVLEPFEMLTWIRIPALPPGTTWGFAEIARRRGDFASAGAAVVLNREEGVVSDARCVLFGVADRPILLDPAGLAGRPVTDDAINAFAVSATRDLSPPDEPELRLQHARVSLTRALRDAAKRET